MNQRTSSSKSLTGIIHTSSDEETQKIGEQIAERLGPGDILLLEGDLGAGKTTFSRGVARGLGVAPEEVRSPTFTLINIYRGTLPIYHIDLYRVEKSADLVELGLEEWLGTDGLALVEWGERLGPYRPSRAVWVRILDEGGDRRQIKIEDGRQPNGGGSAQDSVR